MVIKNVNDSRNGPYTNCDYNATQSCRNATAALQKAASAVQKQVPPAAQLNP